MYLVVRHQSRICHPSRGCSSVVSCKLVERRGGRRRFLVAIAPLRERVYLRVQRHVPDSDQRSGVVDKLVVTGSSPVPPMSFSAKRQHRLPLSLTTVNQDRIEREDDNVRRVPLSRSGRFVVSLTTQTLVIFVGP
jgi:hypothetical protein